MARVIEAEGGRWHVMAGRHPPHPGVGTLLFFPSNGQRGYRVVELPSARLTGADALDAFGDDELLELFARAGVMDFAHATDVDGAHSSRRVRSLPNVGAV